MSTSKVAQSARIRGRAQFLVRQETETVDVLLDRRGFRRLLQSLEQLAETGESQVFEKSGRRLRDDQSSASDHVSLRQLTFSIEE